jgi:hypothetical protein
MPERPANAGADHSGPWTRLGDQVATFALAAMIVLAVGLFWIACQPPPASQLQGGGTLTHRNISEYDTSQMAPSPSHDLLGLGGRR